jgi:hypothetical protein
VAFDKKGYWYYFSHNYFDLCLFLNYFELNLKKDIFDLNYNYLENIEFFGVDNFGINYYSHFLNN